MSTTTTTASEIHDISKKMIEERLGVAASTIWRWRKLGLLPEGKRRPGVRGLFYTTAQANRLIRLTGSKVEKFTDLEDI